MHFTVPHFFFFSTEQVFMTVCVHYVLVFNCCQSFAVYASFPFSCITILSYCEYLYWLQLPTSTNKAVVNILISQYETVSGMLISEQAFWVRYKHTWFGQVLTEYSLQNSQTCLLLHQESLRILMSLLILQHFTFWFCYTCIPTYKHKHREYQVLFPCFNFQFWMIWIWTFHILSHFGFPLCEFSLPAVLICPDF